MSFFNRLFGRGEKPAPAPVEQAPETEYVENKSADTIDLSRLNVGAEIELESGHGSTYRLRKERVEVIDEEGHAIDIFVVFESSTDRLKTGIEIGILEALKVVKGESLPISIGSGPNARMSTITKIKNAKILKL